MWIKQQKSKSIKVPKLNKHGIKSYVCGSCEKSFHVESDLSVYLKTHMKKKSFNCKMCNKCFDEKDSLKIHAETHIQVKSYNCETCGKSFLNEDNFNEHIKTHRKHVTFRCDKYCFDGKNELATHLKTHGLDTPSEIKGRKCGKVYSNMSKLRRHDWRSHMMVECNICGVGLNSREEIGSHRRSEHQMFRRMQCKYFPDCIDEEECFFAHDENVSPRVEETRSRYCLKGESCEDQSCGYSEANHKNVKNVMCMFQAKCTRSECMFKHIMDRASFLGEFMPNFRKR